MAVIKLFPTKDATLYSAFPVQNTGLDEITEASTTFLPDSPEVSRFLTQFSTDEINEFIADHVIYYVEDPDTGAITQKTRQWQADLRAYIAEVDGLSNQNTLESYPISLPWNMGTGKYNDVPKTEDGCSWKFRLESGSSPWISDDGKATGARAITNNNIYTLPEGGKNLKTPREQINYITASYGIPQDHIGLYSEDFQKYYVIVNPPKQRHVVRHSTSLSTITGELNRIPVTSIYGKSFTGGNSFLRSGDFIYQDKECTIPYPSESFFRQGQNIFYVPVDGVLSFSTASNDTSRSSRWLDCVWCHCHNTAPHDFDLVGSDVMENTTDQFQWQINHSTPRRCCPAELGCICCLDVKEIGEFNDLLDDYFGGFGDIDSPNPPTDVPPIVPNKLLGFTSDSNQYPIWEDLQTARDWSLITKGSNIKSSGDGYVVIPSLTEYNNDIDSTVFNDLNSSDIISARSNNPFIPSSSRVQFIEVADNYQANNPGGGTWFTGSIDGLPVASRQRLNYTSDKDIKMNVTNTIRLINSGTIDNNGFIIKQSDNNEFKESKAKSANIKYFSIDTHTIYPPHLDMKVDDCIYSPTSSMSTIDTQEIVATLAQNQGEYRRGSIQKFYINCRPQFPERTFSTDSDYNKNFILPQNSYYAIKDLATNEFIIDFDTTFTKISADSKGSYFTLYMNGLEPERYYQVLIKTTINGTTLVLDDNYYFKVING